MKPRALLLVLLVPLSHWAYHAFDDGFWGAQWAQWIAEHGSGAIMALLLLEVSLQWKGWARTAGAAACVWMAVEDLQCMVCGSLDWGEPNEGKWLRLCTDRVGTEPYIVVFAASAAFIITRGIRAWTSRPMSQL